MSLVIDSSVALSSVFADETQASVDRILEMVVSEGAVVPAIWHLEVANGFLQGVKRRRIDLQGRAEALADLSAFNIAIDPATSSFAWRRTLELADLFSLTAYDASYLELAERRAPRLATLDRQLEKAGRKLGIPVLTGQRD